MNTENFDRKTILGLVEVVRLEIESKQKKLSVSDDELVQKISDKLAESNTEFATAKEQLRYWGAVTREVAWLEANTEESDEIIRRLKSGDQLFAQRFFYDTEKKACRISRLRSKILSNIKQTYHVEVSTEEFGNIIYTHLWANGTWSVLDKYSRKSSLFCWLADVAQHEVVHYLEKMKIIPTRPWRTVSNTRLLGMSVSPETWKYIINDLMPMGLYRDFLLATLVERKLSKSELAEAFDVDSDGLSNLQKKAEADLKDRLLRSNNGYEEIVLRDKTPQTIEISEGFAKDFYAWHENPNNQNPLADVLGVNLNNGDLQERVVSFLRTIPEILNWTEEERIVWTLRFIENTAPTEVAKRVGRKRSWVDTKYSRLNARFNKAIKKWWEDNAK